MSQSVTDTIDVFGRPWQRDGLFQVGTATPQVQQHFILWHRVFGDDPRICHCWPFKPRITKYQGLLSIWFQPLGCLAVKSDGNLLGTSWSSKLKTMKVDEFRDQEGFYWWPKGWKNINSAESSSLGEVQHLLFLPASSNQKYVHIDTLQICPIPWSVRSPSRDLRWHDPPNRFLAAFPACTRQPSCLGERKEATVGMAEVSFSACQVGVIEEIYCA